MQSLLLVIRGFATIMRLSFGWLLLAFLADLFSLFVLADALGAWWSLAWVLFAMLLGIYVIFDAGDTLKTLGGIFATPSERVQAIRETPWLVVVGILFFLPGVISDVLAVIIWFPSLRRRLLRAPSAATGRQNDNDTEAVTATCQPPEPHRRTEALIIEGEWIEKKDGGR
jgi:UPF0716 family protein affecting phage T7 exclusion